MKDGEDIIDEKALVFMDEDKCIKFCKENPKYGWNYATLIEP